MPLERLRPLLSPPLSWTQAVGYPALNDRVWADNVRPEWAGRQRGRMGSDETPVRHFTPALSGVSSAIPSALTFARASARVRAPSLRRTASIWWSTVRTETKR
jgi:hypothetical protein